jgi:histidinol-phosphate aminotransferase
VVAILERAGFEVAGPAVANFVYAETGGDARALFEALLRQGVIVRPLNGFGSDTAIRVTVGTPEENVTLAEALDRVAAAATK